MKHILGFLFSFSLIVPSLAIAEEKAAQQQAELDFHVPGVEEDYIPTSCKEAKDTQVAAAPICKTTKSGSTIHDQACLSCIFACAYIYFEGCADFAPWVTQEDRIKYCIDMCMNPYP